MGSTDTAQTLTLVISVLFPVIVAYVTKASWDGGIKAVLLAAIAAASGIISAAMDPAHTFHWQAAALTALGAFVVAVATHYGLWKPSGVTVAAQAMGVRDDHDLAA